MPLTNFDVTELAYDDHRMEEQLLQEKTGRKMVLDPDWVSLPASAAGLQSFLYDSEIEFILIRTDCEIEFRRVVLIDSEALPACSRWSNRSEERYYIFKVDPAQEVLVLGNLPVRFFRSPNEGEQASASEDCPSTTYIPTFEGSVRPWEAEDVYGQRDVTTDEILLPEHLAEAARRFQAWRAMTTNSLFIYMMVPKHLNESEWIQLLDNGIQFFDDVPWVLGV